MTIRSRASMEKQLVALKRALLKACDLVAAHTYNYAAVSGQLDRWRRLCQPRRTSRLGPERERRK